MHFNGNQAVQGPKDSFIANCSKGFTQFHMMNKGLIKRKDCSVCTETVFWTLNRMVPIEDHYMEKNLGMFSSKTLISFRLKKE